MAPCRLTISISCRRNNDFVYFVYDKGYYHTHLPEINELEEWVLAMVI
jgi:hypothetical protein